MAEMLAFLVRLLVVRCLAFEVVQAMIRARGNLGALRSTGAASSALKWERDSAGAFACAQYVARYLMMTPERAGGRTR